MIRFVRSATIKPGQVPAAMTFASEISDLVESKTGVSVDVFVQLGGPVGRICWTGDFGDLGLYEEVNGVLMNDSEYLAKIGEAAGLFIEGQTKDSFWKQR